MDKQPEIIDINKKIFPNSELFPTIDKIDELLCDEVGLYSISRPKEAEEITSIIKKSINVNKIIDATAGIGGNTISFAKHFPNVISIEIDNLRFDILKHNIGIYELNNVQFINGSCLDFLDKIDGDVWFFDPPWGGPDYKYSRNLEIKIDNMSLTEIVNKLRNKYVVFKLPFNFDMSLLSNFDYMTHKVNNYILVLICPEVE